MGRDFIECHHIVPLSEMGPRAETRLEYLGLVCSNCHAMLHRDSGQTIEELRKIVEDRRKRRGK